MSTDTIQTRSRPSVLAPPGRRRRLGVLVCGLFLVLLTAGTVPTASAAPPALPAVAVVAPVEVDQCNDWGNGGGNEVRCNVTVTNNFNVATLVASSTVTVQECLGAAGAAICDPERTTSYAGLVTSVYQCNYSVDGGGSNVACNVSVINNITGAATATPATINQCNDSGAAGEEPTVVCDPEDRSDTLAAITQCNGSANDGTAPRRVLCEVSPSTETSALPFTVNQCNNSANGGGSTVVCSTSMVNRITAISTPVIPPDGGDTPTATPTPTPTATPTPTPTPTPSASATPVPVPGTGSSGTTLPLPTGPVAGGPGSPPDTLAFTGDDAGQTALLAGALVMLGGLAITVSVLRTRRVRREAESLR